MQARTRWWLIGIIALVVAAALGVTEPIKFRPRKNPATGKVEKPLKRFGPIRIYRPHLGITLGLDLRGGMHLVLQAQREAEFEFELSEPVPSDKRQEILAKVVEALPKEAIYGKGNAKGLKRDVRVVENGVVVRTQIPGVTHDDALKEMERQKKIIAKLVTKALPDAKLKGASLKEVSPSDLASIERILDRRVNAFGVAEPVIQQQRPDRIIVELPGVKDPERARQQLQKTAVLEFRAIPRKYAYGNNHPPEYSSDGKVIGFTLGDQLIPPEKVLDESPIIATGRDLKPNSRVQQTTKVQVTFELTGQARNAFRDYTRANINHYLAVVLDGKIISCPIVRAVIPGEGVIEGGFDHPGGLEEARDLSVLLNAGALPFELKLVENRTVSPELGAGELHKSLLAGAVGLVLVLVFMAGYYRMPGLVADLALILYCILLLGAIKLIGQVLTLPGILAVIISIGMAVDANVIIFERLKEEIRTGKTMRSAVDAAFKRAWAAIFDSNVCSIGTGVVLAAFGTGPIKGFAVALIVGVAVSLFTAVTVTRLFMNLVVDSSLGDKLHLYGVSPSEIESA